MSPNNALIFRFITFIFAQSALRQNVSPFVFRHLDTMYFSKYVVDVLKKTRFNAKYQSIIV
jgi:hypothetical protein